MALRYGDRNQSYLFPKCIDDYVGKDDPVRVYDGFIEAVNLRELGFTINDNRVGNSEYDPKAMIKILVYGYSYGVRSSRKLERSLHHNLSFIWLAGGLLPDHKTIARFRRDNIVGLKKLLKQSARICIKLGLIEGNTLFVDGSKIRANAGIKHTLSVKGCAERLKKIDDRIDEILKECDIADEQEAHSGSFIEIKEELRDKEVLKGKIEEVLKEIRESGKESMNIVDRDCVKVKGRQGIHAGYNGQIVVDDKNGLIVSCDVANESNDVNQFSKQIKSANEVLGKRCKTACGDAGYSSVEVLKEIDEQGILVIVPNQQQVGDKEVKGFSKSEFKYDKEGNNYRCREGHLLKYVGICKEKGHLLYRIEDKELCRNCKHFGICTKDNNGRRIRRLRSEEIKEKLEKQYLGGLNIYKRRKERVEHPYGHIKRNLGVSGFLMRGLEGVRGEMGMLATCFNISRMITILGVSGMMAKLVC